jgi:hypothetical protein
MEDSRFARFGVYLGGDFSGCVSLEQVSRNIIGFHVATRRHTFHPDSVARLLLSIAGDLFTQGIIACVAHAPVERRAVAKLALRCGMTEYGHTSVTRYFMLTRQTYYAKSKTAGC